MKKNLSPLIFAIILVVLAGVSRFIPHPFNFTAIGAMALFSGAVIRNKNVAFLLPLTVMAITDLFIGFHFSMLPVYGCLALTVWLGMRIRNNRSAKNIVLNSILSSIVFYLITNLPFWYADQSLYALNWSGTMESYSMAIPFFKNQVIGDLFYNLLFFGSFFLIFTRTDVIPAKK